MSAPDSPFSVILRGLGKYVPETVLTNDELAARVDTSDEWIRTRTGIRERRIAPADMPTSELAVRAAAQAMERAGVEKDEIDMVIVATCTPDYPFPATACLVQHKLGLRPVPGFDLEAACSGFQYALSMASGVLHNPQMRNVLVIGAEKLSGITDWTDRSTCVLFGDGAGAAVVSRSEEPGVGILASELGADGAQGELLKMPAGGSARPASVETVEGRLHTLQMAGREVFKHAVRVMGQSATTVLERAGISAEEVKIFIPHQANIRIIEAIAQRMGVSMDRFPVNLDRYGNTSAASIPLALEEAWSAGRFGRGDYVLLVGFGAGFTWGASLIKWH